MSRYDLEGYDQNQLAVEYGPIMRQLFSGTHTKDRQSKFICLVYGHYNPVKFVISTGHSELFHILSNNIEHERSSTVKSAIAFLLC